MRSGPIDLDFDPNQLFQQGINLLNQEKYSESKIAFDKLLDHFSKNTDLLNIVGFVNMQLNLFNESIEVYSLSLNIKPNQLEALFNRAIVFSKLKKYKLSITDYESILKIDSQNIGSLINLSAIYEDLGEFDKALIEINKAIMLNPKNHTLLANRGNIKQSIFDYLGAYEDYSLALKLSPNNPDLYISIGNIHKQLKNFDKAEDAFLKAININPESNAARYNYSLFLLYQKRYDKGWDYCEYRDFEKKSIGFLNNIKNIIDFDQKKNILIWAEQGIGDQILYSSIFSDLKSYKNITVALDKRLISIYERSFSFLKFLDIKKIVNPENQYDLQIPIGSLGKYFRNAINKFKSQPKFFLKTDAAKVEVIKQKFFQSGRKKIGLAWKSKNKKIGHAKSMNLFELSELFKLKGLDFFDLQYGNTDFEKLEIEKKLGVQIHTLSNLDKFNDLEGMLNLIEACDCIVTTSNVTAHLAGAIGKKTYLLAPYGIGNIWYWHDDKISLWYPSIEIIRQTETNNWCEATSELVIRIKSNFL